MIQFSNQSSRQVNFEITGNSLKDGTIRFPVIALGLLITSFFFVLPLTRLSFLGTDLRLYDISFLVFFLLIGFRYWPQLRELMSDRTSFTYLVKIFLTLVWLSLIMTATTGGMRVLLPAILRSIRFTYYFITAAFVVILAKSPRSYRFLLLTFYANIIVQAIIAYAQSRNLLPNFWPDYWLVSYGDFPVGTLSPHHKHIGVVMLLGISLSLSLYRITRNLLLKIFLLFLIGIMISITVYSVSRTAWLGLITLFIAYIFVHRRQSFDLIPVIFGIVALYFFVGVNIKEPLSQNINFVLLEPLRLYGLNGILGERMAVYDNFPDALQENPWILLVGSGFQNISKVLKGPTGAHNNYIQALFELGIFGFFIYIGFLVKVLNNLNSTAQKVTGIFERNIALGAMLAFIAVMSTMLVGETLWAQYSMFTLTGQIMTYMGLACAPLYWESIS